MKGDLQVHTKLSDGSLGVEDLIIFAARKGVEALSITDRDYVLGVSRGILLGKRYNVNVIAGALLSSCDKTSGKRLDILAYDFKEPERLEGICYANRQAYKRASSGIFAKLSKRYPITREFVNYCAEGSTNIFPAHMMRALMECGFSKSIYGEIYEDLFSETSPNNIIMHAKYKDFTEIISAIHEAGGIAVLSHPYLYDSLPLLPALIKKGLDGIEVGSPFATDRQMKELYEIAKCNGLITTSGSDFRGLYTKSNFTLGDITADDKEMDTLITFNAKKKRREKKTQKAAQKEIIDRLRGTAK